MLKRGDADIAYAMTGELGEEVRRTPGSRCGRRRSSSTHWLVFADQWDPSSPWHDRRVRLAATHAVDRQAINQAETLGFSKITGSIIPTSFDFYWQPPTIPYDPAKAKQLLAEAGYPKGFDAGDFWCDAGATSDGEAVLNYLQAAGIRTKLRPLERAAFLKAYQEKKLKNLIYGLSGIFGNAATRIEAFTASSGAFAYGGYPGHRRALPRPGDRARPEEARGDAPPDPAAHAREGRCTCRSGSSRCCRGTARASPSPGSG